MKSYDCLKLKNISKIVFENPKKYVEDYNFINTLFNRSEPLLKYHIDSYYFHTLQPILVFLEQECFINKEEMICYSRMLQKSRYEVLFRLVKIFYPIDFLYFNLDVSRTDIHRLFTNTKSKINMNEISYQALYIYLVFNKHYSLSILKEMFLKNDLDQLSYYDLETRTLIKLSYIISILKNQKFKFPYFFIDPSKFISPQIYYLFLKYVNDINENSPYKNKIIIIHLN